MSIGDTLTSFYEFHKGLFTEPKEVADRVRAGFELTVNNPEKNRLIGMIAKTALAALAAAIVVGLTLGPIAATVVVIVVSADLLAFLCYQEMTLQNIAHQAVDYAADAFKSFFGIGK